MAVKQYNHAVKKCEKCKRMRSAIQFKGDETVCRTCRGAA